LKPDHVLGANRVGLPRKSPRRSNGRTRQRRVERAHSVENPLQLPEFTYIAPGVQRRGQIAAQGEPNLVGFMPQNAGHYVMAATAQLFRQTRSYSSQPAGN
jgi:hypothetical protein